MYRIIIVYKKHSQTYAHNIQTPGLTVERFDLIPTLSKHLAFNHPTLINDQRAVAQIQLSDKNAYNSSNEIIRL